MDIWQTPSWPNFRHDAAATEGPLADFSARLGSIKGLQMALSAEERRETFMRAVTNEAVASFAIEGAILRAEEIEASVVASLAHRGAEPQRRTDAIATLMLEAREGQGALSEDRLFYWHQLLFHGVDLEDKGRWRSFPIVIVRGANVGKEEVLYSAPPHDRVPAMMQEFLTNLQTDRRPVPVRAAIAHLWFESIHPFSDGNGRIGRALIEYIFAQDAALPFSLSRQIESDKQGYYRALQAGRMVSGDHIDATPFVLWFLERLTAGIVEAEAEARFLVMRNAYFMRFSNLSQRGEKVLRRLFAEGPRRVSEGISAGPYSKIAGVSLATATRDLVELEAVGAVFKGVEGGRSTRYLLSVS
ncbi:MAG: Fic family protein [Rhodobacteraceae bacterium]|nr:Fic family protein [Paracoccaceae bacterium]